MEQEVKKKNRDRIGVVLYGFYIVLLLMSVLLIAKFAYLEIFFKPDPTIYKVLTPTNSSREIEPARGNIIDCEGRLLAMSTPSYQIAMDCTVLRDKFAADKKEGSQKEAEWLAKARKLSFELERVFPEKTADQYYNTIRECRKNGKKYLKIGKPVDRNTYNQILKFPLFEEGRYKGGLSVTQNSVRTYPYGDLARRTIGFVRNNSEIVNSHIGLEGKFDYVLHGVNGKEWLRVTDLGRVRNNDSTYVKAEDGKDIRTTLNIDYQGIADKALREQLGSEEDVEGATLVLMEVSTGAIRAMVNLMKPQGKEMFDELTNYAVGRAAEPGSVFKTVTLMSVLNDGYIKSLDETLPTNHGNIAKSGLKQDIHILDYEREKHTSEISILDGFKISSNYVFGKLAIDNYGRKPEKYVQNIHSYKLAETFDFDLDGLANPMIPSPKNPGWHMSTLGTMGFGYSTEETPIHILTFYNAIANKGRMMKPYLVEDIETAGIVSEKRGPSILSSAICSRAVADTLNRALKAVTEEGTAKVLKNAKCSVAGKTGTSFGTFPAGERGESPYYDKNGRRKYQGTFVGYFPADDPQYSIICMVYSNPTHKQFQGGGIPARAIKTVVNELWAIDPYFRTTLKKTR